MTSPVVACEGSATDSSGPAFAEDPRSWGQRLADSTIAEHPSAWNMRKSDGEYRWAYNQGLVALGMYRLHKRHDEPRYYAYMKAYVDHYVDAGGNIRTLALDEFNIDSINSGKLLFPLLQDTGDARYRAAIEMLHRQLQWQPRTHNGVFWHKRKYPWQVWLDGLYMGAPFYAEYAARFGPAGYFDDIGTQFRESYAKLRDAETGRMTLRNVCRSAGLGGRPYRDGTYSHYISTDVVENDTHGIGAFLLASAEIE